MTNYSKILQLHNEGNSQNSIAKTCHVAKKTINKLMQILDDHGIDIDKAISMDNTEIELLMKKSGKKHTSRPLPDIESCYRKYAAGAHLRELFKEYQETCSNGKPIQYTRFFELMKAEIASHKATRDMAAKPGVIVVWWSNIIHTDDGHKVYLAVFCYPYSQKITLRRCDRRTEEMLVNAVDAEFSEYGAPAYIKIDTNYSVAMQDLLDQYELKEMYLSDVIQIELRELHKRINDNISRRGFCDPYAVDEAAEDFSTYYNNEMLDNGKSRQEIFDNDEKPVFRNVMIEKFIWKKAKPQYNCHVQFDGSYYSIPAEHISAGSLELRVTADKVDIYRHDKLIASHARLHRNHQYSTFPEHMPTKEQSRYLKWNSSRFIRMAMEVGEACEFVISSLLAEAEYEQQAYKTCMSILSLRNLYSDEDLELACISAVRDDTYYSFKRIKQFLE